MDYPYMAVKYLDKVQIKYIEDINFLRSVQIRELYATSISKLGRIEEALNILENCRVSLINNKSNRTEMGVVYIDMGRVCQDAENYEEALEYFNKAEKHFIIDSEIFIYCLCLKAFLLRKCNKKKELSKCLEIGLPLVSKGTLWYDWLDMIKHSTDFDNKPSRMYVESTAIPNLLKYGKHLLVMEGYKWLGEYYESVNTYKSAMMFHKKATEIYQKLMKGDLSL